jgi:magnesium and cobalt transporter
VTIQIGFWQWALMAVLLLAWLAYSTVCAAWTGAGWRIRQRQMQEELSSRNTALANMVADGYRVQLSLRLARQLLFLSVAAVAFIALRPLATDTGRLALMLLAAAGVVFVIEILMARGLASAAADGIFRRSLALVRPVYIVFMPLTWVPMRLHRLFAQDGGEDDQPSEAEVEAFIDVGEEEGILEEDESELLRSIVDFGETTVSEVMTPRTDMVCAVEGTTIADLRDLVVEERHSRIPVYRETMDQVVGVAYARDLLEAWREGRADEPLGDLVRQPLFVPETKKIDELMKEFQENRVQAAIVVDEYGGTAGMVTLEDLLEEIVGEIQDEYDEEEPLLIEQEDGAWLAAAMLDVDEFFEQFGLPEASADYDTLGGLAIAELGHVPAVGETFEYQGVVIEVVEADDRRIHRLRLRGPRAGGD